MNGVERMENDVRSRAASMLRKMKVGQVYNQGDIDVYGTTDAQAFASLLLANKIEFVKGRQQLKLVEQKPNSHE